jgi:hypothetical protein
LETISYFLNRTIPKIVKHLNAAVLRNVAFLDGAQCSLVKHISAIEFENYAVSLHVMKTNRGVKVQSHPFSALHGDE